MMRADPRGLGRWWGVLAGALVLAPALALFAAAVSARGPIGTPRLTVFPLALAVFDDLVWDSIRNSLAAAVGVTLAARVLGVAVARVAVRWRFWGRRLLGAALIAGVVVPPAFGALGLRAWSARTGQGVNPWLAWFWVALTAGVPLVVLASGSALGRVDPVWEDAARLVGANRRRIWRHVAWPVVRPEVARALGLVFVLTLLEPGAPIVLGLRRTLGFQIVAAARDMEPGQLTRAAVLAVLGLLVAGSGRLVIAWWGGPRAVTVAQVETPVVRPSKAGLVRGGIYAFFLAVATGVLWVPVAALVASGASFDGFRRIVGDPLTREYVSHSAILGVSVVVLDLILAGALANWAVGRTRRPGATARFDGTEALPPLAIGVGVLALPWALRALASALFGSTGSGVSTFEAMADGLDVDRVPWVALVFAVGLARLPLLKRSAIDRRRTLRPAMVEVAMTLGARPRRARRRLSGSSPRAALLTLALACTSVTPALLLAPTAETRPVGPAVLLLADEPGDGLRRASTLASLALGVNLAALAVASVGRPGLVREWFRG